MKWNEFLNKVSDLKTKYAASQVSLNIGSLTTLIYAGAFDSMLDEKPTYKTYENMVIELKKAMKSLAAPQKAKKNDMFGIANIDSELVLNLWRSEVNPLHKFNLLSLIEKNLQEMGYEKRRDTVLPYYNSKTKTYISTAWGFLFDHPLGKVFSARNGEDCVAFVGVITEVKDRPLKDGRESIVFNMYIGGETAENIRVWPNHDGIVSYKKSSVINKGKMGLATVKLGTWNDQKQASLLNWQPITLPGIDK